ncbi:MAG: DUF3558 family protein [Acidimicrobiales bacterium]
MMALLAGCGGNSSGDAVDATLPDAPAASGSTKTEIAAPTTPATPTTVNAASGTASGTPSRKPCDLLTKKIAEEALGIAVGAPTQAPGQGNETCNYRATDTSVTAMVYLTTYAAKGSTAALDQAAAQFKNAYAVNGVGDAARVSVDEHAIGVLKGDFVFAVGLIPPSRGQVITPVTEAQMVKLANAVLERV